MVMENGVHLYSVFCTLLGHSVITLLVSITMLQKNAPIEL